MAECESGLDPTEIDDTRENWGMFQLNEHGDESWDGWRPYFGEERWSHVLEAEENVDMAVEIWERAGRTWDPWACKP